MELQHDLLACQYVFIVIFALAVQVNKRKRKKYIQPLMDFRGYSSGVSESSNGMSIIGN